MCNFNIVMLKMGAAQRANASIYNFDIAIRQFIEYLVFGDTSKSLLIDYLNISDD